MPIEFRCNQCNKLLRVDDASAGKKARCPECATIQQIPASTTLSSTPVSDYKYYGQSTPANPAQPGAVPMSAPPSSSSTPDSTSGAQSGGYTTTPVGATPPSQSSPPGYTSAGSPFAPQPASAANPYSDQAAPNPYTASPHGYSAHGYSGLSPAQRTQQARQRVKPPAIVMMVISLMFLVIPGFFFLIAIAAMNDGEEEPAILMVIFGVVSGVAACVPFLSGLMMMSMRAWGLCMARIVVSIVFSLITGCFPVTAIAIWALVVLVDADVRAAFR